MQTTIGKSEIEAPSVRLRGEGQHPERMQGHWVLARAGKRVLRPGGVELTRKMLDALAITAQDRVVEFAPGRGATAEIVLGRAPAAYWGIEREPAAAEHLQQQFAATGARFLCAQAEASGLPDACASIVFGEALLSMQNDPLKRRIFAEAQRLLIPGGRYGIHELCFLPANIADNLRHEIQAALATEIHVGVQPLPRAEWVQLFEQNGMRVTWSAEAPVHLLEPRRLLRDEGLIGSLHIGFNMASDRMLRQRMLGMRRIFRRYRDHLGAISLVGERALSY